VKRYLITGASRGIGRAISEKFAGKDVELLLHGRDTVALAETRKVVEPQCARVTPLIHDLATARGVSDLIADVGRPSIDLRVINLYPAATDTNIWSQVESKWPRDRMMSATQIADAVAFASTSPMHTLVENITLSSLVGNL